MTTITQVSKAMQAVLSEAAEKAGRESGFIKRRRKLSGASFVQMLVFGWMANGQASLEELSQTAAMCGVEISSQGINERFNEAAARCLKQVLEASIGQLVQHDGGHIGILGRFKGVYLQDSTILQLPFELREMWRGSGNQNGQGAGMKVQTVFEYQAGRLSLSLHPAICNDRPLQCMELPTGALRLTDTGYFDLQRFSQLDKRGVFWLSRLPANVHIWHEDGTSISLSRFLSTQAQADIDQVLHLTQRRIACRVLAKRVPSDVAEQRRQRLREQAARRRKPVSQEAYLLAEWTILATNLPPQLLSLEEALVLIRLRWQIELLFKLWKSHAVLTTSRSSQPWRILCEVYAKLLMLVVQHWLLLLGCWNAPNRSLVKAAKAIRNYAFHLAASFPNPDSLALALDLIGRVISRARLSKRRSRPPTFQLLEALS